jgi:hypothetical protein
MARLERAQTAVGVLLVASGVLLLCLAAVQVLPPAPAPPPCPPPSFYVRALPSSRSGPGAQDAGMPAVHVRGRACWGMVTQSSSGLARLGSAR